MNTIKFSYNWNKKLCCTCFTTLRINNKHNIGDVVMITLKGKERGLATVVDKKELNLDGITNALAYIDTGYNAEDTKKLLMKMYKNKNIDWNRQHIYLYVLQYQISDNLPCMKQKKFIDEMSELTK